MTAIRFLSLVAIAALALMPVACSDDDAAAGSTVSATVKIIPGSADFGQLRVGQSATIAMIIKNDTGVPITLNSAAMETGGDFSIVGFNYAGEVLVPGVGLNFKVLFAPSDAVASSDRIVIAYNGSKSVTAAIKGEGALPDLVGDVITVSGSSFATFDPLPVSYQFSEAANVDSGAFSVAVVLSTDLDFDPATDWVIAGKFRLSMDASEVDSGTITDGIIPQAPPAMSGAYFVGLAVDWTEGQPEITETNNIAWTSTTIDITFFEFRFTGTVTNAVTTDPLVGALVSADGISTTTDANGDYDFRVSNPGPHNLSAGASGFVGETRNVTASSTQDFQLSAPENILILAYCCADATIETYTAVNNMFPAVNLVRTASTFTLATQLQSGTKWDIVIYSTPSSPFGNLINYNVCGDWIRDGGRFIWVAWDQGSFTTSTLWSALEGNFAGTHNTLPIVPFDRNHPIVTAPNNWPDATGWVDRWGSNGSNVTPTGSAVVLAGVTSDPTSAPMLISGNGGKTLIIGNITDDARGIDNDSDGKLDALEMWENFISYVLGH